MGALNKVLYHAKDEPPDILQGRMRIVKYTDQLVNVARTYINISVYGTP